MDLIFEAVKESDMGKAIRKEGEIIGEERGKELGKELGKGWVKNWGKRAHGVI